MTCAEEDSLLALTSSSRGKLVLDAAAAHLSPPLIPNFGTIHRPSALHCTAKRPPTTEQASLLRQRQKSRFILKYFLKYMKSPPGLFAG